MGVVGGKGACGGRWSWPVGSQGRWGAGAGGFTVLELLIVIVIAAVLVGVTVPVYVVAREQQRRLTCSGYLHQVYVALRQYQEDEGGFPPAYRPRTDVDPATSPLDPAYGCDYGAVAALLQPGFGHLSRSLHGPKTPGEAHPIGLRCPDDFTPDTSIGSYYSTYSEYYNYWGYDAEGLPFTDPRAEAPDPPSSDPGDPNYWNPAPQWDWEGPEGMLDGEWPAGIPRSSKWDFVPKLGNEYYDTSSAEWKANPKHSAPPSTIVTRCPYHRRRLTGPELILRLDGHYERIKYSDWLQQDDVGDPFVYQPVNLGRR